MSHISSTPLLSRSDVAPVLPAHSFDGVKTIKVNGLTYKVPVWVHFVATDANGHCWGYRTRPMKGVAAWFVAGGDYHANPMHFIDLFKDAGHWGRSIKAV